MNQTHYTIHGINGPVVKVTGGKGLAMMDMVSVGEEGLIGEVVSVDRSATTVQVYEDTAGLKPGQPVVSQGAPMAITLGPGMLTNIFDGIARPLGDGAVWRDRSDHSLHESPGNCHLQHDRYAGRREYSGIQSSSPGD